MNDRISTTLKMYYSQVYYKPEINKKNSQNGKTAKGCLRET